MKLHPQEFKTRSPTIFYKPYPTVNMKPGSKVDSINLYIKTRPSETGSKTVSLYIPVFRTGSEEAWIKFQTTLHKIIKLQSLNT